MATKDNDLFDRLRQAGLRKQVAKTLSEIGEGASKRARRALSDLHSVVDELEKRLPGAITPSAAKPATTRSSAARKPAATKPAATKTAAATSTAAKPAAARRRSSSAAKPAASRSRSTTSRSTASRSSRATATRSRAARPAAAAASTASATPARAPRGANKAKILGSLRTGAKTASEIAKETGIGTGTVGSTLSKLAISGEVVKAPRGYALPS